MTTFIQDIKSRGVWWFIFPMLTGLMGYLHFLKIYSLSGLILSSLINICTLGLLMMLSIFYFKLKRKNIRITGLIGLGDILFFLALAVGFPMVSFIYILTSCLILSLVLHLLLKDDKFQTVPLAGYASIGLFMFYSADWLQLTNNLYTF